MSIKTNIMIVGAGLVGMTAACALAKLGLDIVVIDSADLEGANKKESDGRTCAIASGSADFFRKTGVWDDMQRNAGEILDIRVTDGNAPVFLHYDHRLVGDEPMGYIIENYHLREALFKRAADFSGNNQSKGRIRIIAPAYCKNIEFGDNECITSISYNLQANQDEVIASQLVIAADGKNSHIRSLAGIKTHSWNYEQSAIVCTIEHEKHHQNIAQERFLPEGPFAILPMKGGYHSSLVWTEKNELIPIYISMSDAEIEEQIAMRAGEYLGKIKLASGVSSYPLSLCKAKRYIGKGLALVGDAAHAMHPLAGQGFNVGIRDVQELVNLIEEGYFSKQGGAHCKLLKKYEAARMIDSVALLTITDALNRLFLNDIFSISAARKIGLLLVNQAKPLKKFFMQHAMGK